VSYILIHPSDKFCTEVHGFRVVRHLAYEYDDFTPRRITVDLKTAEKLLHDASEDEILTGYIHFWEGETIASLTVWYQGHSELRTVSGNG
jgi:hypothetical protein